MFAGRSAAGRQTRLSTEIRTPGSGADARWIARCRRVLPGIARLRDEKGCKWVAVGGFDDRVWDLPERKSAGQRGWARGDLNSASARYVGCRLMPYMCSDQGKRDFDDRSDASR